MRIEPPARFGGHVDLLRAFFQHLGDQPFAAAITIDIGRIDKIDPFVKGGMQGIQGIFFAHVAPVGA